MAMTTSQGQPAAPAAEVDIAAITLQVLEGKTTVGEQRGLSAQQLEAGYAMAYNFYHQKKFADAEKAFRFLVFYNHLDRRFWKGLGASLHMQKDYGGAVQAYA